MPGGLPCMPGLPGELTLFYYQKFHGTLRASVEKSWLVNQLVGDTLLVVAEGATLPTGDMVCMASSKVNEQVKLGGIGQVVAGGNCTKIR